MEAVVGRAPPPGAGSGTASTLATGIASRSDVHTESLSKDMSLLIFVPGATESTAQLLPSKSSTTVVSHACGGIPSKTSETLLLMGTNSACACLFQGRNDSGAPTTNTGGIVAT
jgi:hypothetical protein